VDELLTRRRLLGGVIAGLAGLAGAVVAVPILAYLLHPLIDPAGDEWRDVGPVDQFKVGETVEVSIQEPSPLPWSGQTATTAAWLRRTSDSDFIAFAVNCTHLDCPVSWLQDAGLFMCPCHGGVYYSNGDVAGGPPPRPLFRQPVRIRDGRVEILTRGLQVA
jgi:menaquinol-cytochrome c reductase iron-sulfur subunit